MKLKDNAIYALPDGREFVVRPGRHGGYLLHDPGRGSASAPVYFIDSSGQVLSWGRRTRWLIDDLRETGRMSLPEMDRLRLL